MSIEERLARCVAPWLATLERYHVEDPGDLVKLDAMENPYPLPPSLRAAWAACVAETPLNRYPDPEARAVKAALARVLDLPPGLAIALGNGSDELIQLLGLAFARNPGAVILAPEPSFAVYRISALALGIEYVGVPLAEPDFALDRAAMLAAIATHAPALVFLASPNNPTGNRLDHGALEDVCAATPGVVVLDEAYYRFAGRTRVAEAAAIENLLVLHTLSKIGLAGLRVGALIGQRPWIDVIERLRMPYNISALSQAGATFALTHIAAFERQIETIVAARAALQAALARIDGLEVWPSETNFILLRVPIGRGPEVFAALKAEGVLVKNLSGGHPRLADCLRVTVGTEDENDLLLRALTRALV